MAETLNTDQSDDLFAVNVEVAVFKESDGALYWLMGKRAESEGHAGGDISPLGGTVEWENAGPGILEDTALREIQEESGVTIGNPIYLRSDAFRTDSGTAVMNIVMLAPYISGEPHVTQPEETDWVRWMTLDEINDDPCVQPWTRESMKKANENLTAQIGGAATRASQI